MSGVNFLPASYLAHKRQQRQGVRRLLLCLLIALSMSLWSVAMRDRLSGLEQYARAVEQEADAVRGRVSEVDKQKALKESLTRQLAIQRQLLRPVSTMQVLATLSQVLPESVAVEELEITSPMPQPRQQSQDTEKTQARSVRQVEITRKQSVPVVEPVMRVSLTALAPDDSEVARVVGVLSDQAPLRNIKLNYSRAAKSGAMIARQFQLEFEIPLNRRELPAPVRAEVAHVQ